MAVSVDSTGPPWAGKSTTAPWPLNENAAHAFEKDMRRVVPGGRNWRS
jgi:hypothetical protein